MATREQQRLHEADRGERPWRLFGPYLSERQWGTVREDYSAGGNVWEYLSHDDARSRAYRWGEDGLLGISDDQSRLCFALALWNGRDPILKERLYGLTGPEGNHGEDVKEHYHYLDATPSSSYLHALYKYPHAPFPYARLREQPREPGASELELEDLGVLDGGRYCDVSVEYAKRAPDQIAIRIRCSNRGPDAVSLHVLPTVWLRNTWAWGRTGEGYWPEGRIARAAQGLVIEQPALGRYVLAAEALDGVEPRLLFTDNETNAERLFAVPNLSPYVKDAFHRYVVDGELAAVNPSEQGTKAAAWYALELPAGGERELRLQLYAEPVGASVAPLATAEYDALFAQRKQEADEFHAARRDSPFDPLERSVVRQADAGLLWSRQYYGYIVQHWLDGDPAQPPPPPARRSGRNSDWRSLWAKDVISMPDKWEYPWFAAWDLAFQCVAVARIDPEFAKQQLLLLGHERYMHASAQLPAYEFAFGDANPPLHAWAAYRVYQLTAEHGAPRDRLFLERVFQKCIANFTFWVNRKDVDGNNLFAGGFLGLDNIGVFDRSKPLPGGAQLEQADATAWMAFYASTMLAIALELARTDLAYEDIAARFLDHFLVIARAMNELGGSGLWDERDGFYYDRALYAGEVVPLRVRSMVGVIPLFAAETLEAGHFERLPRFRERVAWSIASYPELSPQMADLHPDRAGDRRLLAIAPRERLLRVLRYVLDENELLSPFGVRSLSKHHAEHPYVFERDGSRAEVRYAPGESDSGMFGGNSNWRGPLWFPLNYLLIEALKRHHHYYGAELKVECPVGSGRMLDLREVAEFLELRMSGLFRPDSAGRCPWHGDRKLFADDPHCRGLMLFHEYFHADTGKGLGASHQTGWTALIANVLERVASVRARPW